MDAVTIAPRATGVRSIDELQETDRSRPIAELILEKASSIPEMHCLIFDYATTLTLSEDRIQSSNPLPIALTMLEKKLKDARLRIDSNQYTKWTVVLKDMRDFPPERVF